MKAYEIIADQIIEKLEAGTVPWIMPWNTSGHAPQNLTSGHIYSGINTILTGMSGHQSPFWLTFNQAKKLEGTVRKDEHATKICFWKFLERTDSAGEITTTPLLRYYSVFNSTQCELPAKITDQIQERLSVEKIDFDHIKAAERIIAGYKNSPQIKWEGQRAAYNPRTDTVFMPPPDTFKTEDFYYTSIFHELIHSSGHPSRLKRFGTGHEGREKYAKEELTAEIGSALLCKLAGIEPNIDQSAAYIEGWLRALKNDKRMIISAGSLADKATKHITGAN